MEKSKVDFANKSLKKSSHFRDDPFIRYIVLWIGLNALYSQKGWEINGRNYGEDVVKNYFKGRQETVYSLISGKRCELNEIFEFIRTTEQHGKLFKYSRTRKDFLKIEEVL